jgi:uncharacterized membrane protein YedE/YeeE
MTSFTPLASLAGGVLIGIASALLLLFNGRLAGISGILDSALRLDGLDWRAVFLAGLIIGGIFFAALRPSAFPAVAEASPPVLAAAGVLVGFGTRLSGGCTSGHGVCGIGRASPRSLVATLTFMATGAATVFVVRHLLGVGR